MLFVLVLISHDRRRIVHVNFTEHPSSAWTAQQLVEAFPEDSAPRWLLRDPATFKKDRRLNIRISTNDLEAIPEACARGRSFPIKR